MTTFRYPADADSLAQVALRAIPADAPPAFRQLVINLARAVGDRDRDLEDFLTNFVTSGITTGFPITFSTARTIYLIDHLDLNGGISDDLFMKITDIATGVTSTIRMQNFFGFTPAHQVISLSAGGPNPAGLTIAGSGGFGLADAIHSAGAPVGQAYVDLGVKSGTVVTNLSLAGAWRVVLGGNVTFSFTPSGFSLATTASWEHLFYIQQDGTGGRTVTWPTEVRWAGGVAPTITPAANAIDLILMRTHNQFADVYGQVIGANYS